MTGRTHAQYDEYERFLGSRGTAYQLRGDIEVALRSMHESGCVSVDFSGISGVSHGFADELLTPLSEALGSTVGDHVMFVHCKPRLVELFQAVAELHSLHLPSFGDVSCIHRRHIPAAA